jgi:hypothetical protein
MVQNTPASPSRPSSPKELLMLLPHLKVTSRRLIVFMLLALMFTSGLLVVASWKRSVPKANELAKISQQQRSDTELEAELVTATPTGSFMFRP